MKTKQIFLIIILCLFFAVAGFVGHKIYQENAVSKKIADTNFDTIKNKETDSNFIQKKMPVSDHPDADYSKILKGKFVLAGSEYAGFDFIDSKTIAWTNEMFPMDPDTMRLKWIDENTFVTTFTKVIDKNCPPRNWVRKVEYYDGQKLIIKNFWTGWNDLKDEDETFYKE